MNVSSTRRQNGPVRDDDADSGARDWGWDFGAILRTVPGVQELETAGFAPIETLFGETEIGTAWPVEHRREVLDTRFEQTGQEPWDDDELRLFLVRSPWPSIELDTVVKLMFRWLRRNEDRYQFNAKAHSARVDSAARLTVVEEFFRQSEAWVRAYSKGRINRLA